MMDLTSEHYERENEVALPWFHGSLTVSLASVLLSQSYDNNITLASAVIYHTSSD